MAISSGAGPHPPDQPYKGSPTLSPLRSLSVILVFALCALCAGCHGLDHERDGTSGQHGLPSGSRDSSKTGSQQHEAEPFSRGINSIQLLKRDDRWWIASIVWDVERTGNPIPNKYARAEPVEPR